MTKQALIGLVLFAAACSKSDGKQPPAQGSGSSAKPIAQLPPAGTAPPAVTIDQGLSMWNTPLKTLQGKDAKLADFKARP